MIPTRDPNRPFKKKLFQSRVTTNRFFYEVMPDGAWKGKECFIVGGGPSLRGFDWSKLKGRRTVAINRAFEMFDPTILFSMDTRFLRWVMDGQYGENVKEKFLRTKSYKCWLCTYKASLPDDIFIVKVHKNYSTGFKAFTSSMKHGIGHGNNSGYGALNLVCCLRASPIYLLGFDMKHEGGITHWHKGHPRPQPDFVLKNFLSYFKHSAWKIKQMGIRVINLCPGSALTCFPKLRIEEVLH